MGDRSTGNCSISITPPPYDPPVPLGGNRAARRGAVSYACGVTDDPRDTSLVRPDLGTELAELMRARVLVLDGAMGTAIQRDRPDEAGYRGERFADWPSDLQGNNDLLTLTQPELVTAIHEEYLAAGADIIETNTFNATAVSLRDYGMEELSYEINFESARLARAAVERGHRRRPVPAALRRRRARPHHPHGVDLARRQRPRHAQRQLHRAARRLPGRGPRPGRRRRRPAADRDDLRHPQRQGRHQRGRGALRRARPPLAGRASPAPSPTPRAARSRARPRRPSGTRCATPVRCSWGSTAPSARRRCGPTSPRSRGSPTPSSPATPTPGCPTPSASTTRSPRRPRPSSGSSPTPGCSTSSAAAAAPPRSTSAPSPPGSRASPRARCPSCRPRCGSRASSR